MTADKSFGEVSEFKLLSVEAFSCKFVFITLYAVGQWFAFRKSISEARERDVMCVSYGNPQVVFKAFFYRVNTRVLGS